jgi:hypothetical protein
VQLSDDRPQAETSRGRNHDKFERFQYAITCSLRDMIISYGRAMGVDVERAELRTQVEDKSAPGERGGSACRPRNRRLLEELAPPDHQYR